MSEAYHPSPERDPERFSFGSKAMRGASEVPVIGRLIESSLNERADEMIKDTKVAEYLQPKIVFKDKLAGQVEQGVTVLSVGSGKGHELNEMDMQLPGSKIIGVDPHDHWSGPVEREVAELGNDVSYLPEGVSAEHLEGVPDGSVDGMTFFYVLHHIPKNRYDQVMDEAHRVLKDDGYLFVSEDLVDSKEEEARVVSIDRKLNLEVSKKSPHNYSSKEEWKQFFQDHGFEVVEANEVKRDVRHGFFVLKKVV